MVGVVTRELSVAELADQARRRLQHGARRMLGLVGAPGAGKSLAAAEIVAALAPDAVLVPMDGFHLSGAELTRLRRYGRKGAPDTFDGAGYVSLLRRLRANDEPVIYAPRFDRALDEPIANAIPVPSSTSLVVTEGNYLLLPTEPWSNVRGLLDEVWFIDPDRSVRIERLIARHIEFGKSPEEARAWSLGPDERNAELVARTRHLSDRIVRIRDVRSGPALNGPR